jgi:hypothetical protein
MQPVRPLTTCHSSSPCAPWVSAVSEIFCQLRWKGREHLKELSGRPVRLRLHLRTANSTHFGSARNDRVQATATLPRTGRFTAANRYSRQACAYGIGSGLPFWRSLESTVARTCNNLWQLLVGALLHI